MSEVEAPRSFWTDVVVPPHAPPIEVEHNFGTRDVFVEARYAAPTAWAKKGDFQLLTLVVLDENRVRINGLPPGHFRVVVLR